MAGKAGKQKQFFMNRIVHGAAQYLSESPEAIEYLISRGVTAEQIKSFNLGYIPPDKWPPYIDPKEASPAEAHYLEKSYKGALLKGKLIFPQTNALGMITALQARTPDAGKKDYWKYYTQRAGVDAVFFGTSLAMPHIWETREVYLVEGIFDIFPTQRVFPNTLCAGTAHLDENQIKFLLRHVDDVHIMFDNDTQGRRFFDSFYHKHKRDFKYIHQVGYAGKDLAESWERLGEEGFQKQFKGASGVFALHNNHNYGSPLYQG